MNNRIPLTKKKKKYLEQKNHFIWNTKFSDPRKENELWI